MLVSVLIVVGVVFLGFLALAGVFVIGMRSKTPWVLNGVRRFARGIGNPHQMKSAGTPGAWPSVIRHTGRTSGRLYETPVVAESTEDGFVIAIVYGSNTDWLRNVLASGSATIVNEGDTYQVGQPEIVPIEAAAAYFPAKSRQTHRRFHIEKCLRIRHVGVSDSPLPSVHGARSEA